MNLKNLKKIYLCIFFTCCLSINFYGQLSNSGIISVNKNTDFSIWFDMTNTTTGTINNNGFMHVHRDFTNNGLVSFTDNTNTGKTFFKGTDIQNIDGNGKTLFYNIEVLNNALDASIQLQKEIKIYGNANLTDGILEELGNGLAVFQKGATHNNTSDESFIDNKVHKQGNEAFVFPIGSHNSGTFLYRMAAISAPSNESDIFSAAYIWENSDNTYEHDSKEANVVNINTNEYWVIEPKKGNSIVDVTLSWNSNTTPNSLLTDTSKLIIVRWNGSKWINEGGIADNSSNTITTRPSGYGIFTLASTFGKLLVDDFPDSFSPNGDGINDTFEIPGLADKYPNFTMTIYNRYGNVVYDYKNNGKKTPNWWNGKARRGLNIGGNRTTVPAATYWYILDFNNGTRKPVQKWVYLNK